MSDPRHLIGHAAEAAVARWLSEAGWRVIDRRARPKGHGELDIVAMDPQGVLVGIECRARHTDRFGRAGESVDRRRVDRLRRALAAYAANGAAPHLGLRIDLVTARPEQGDAARWRLRRTVGIG